MINLFKLNRHRRKRFEKHKYIFNHVLKKCHSKIYLSGQQLKTECVYTIPQYIPGMPLFDIRECMRYVIRKLNKNKLIVQVLKPDTILISWEHISLYDRENQLEEENDGAGGAKYQKKDPKNNKNKKKETFRKVPNKPIYSIHSYEKYA